MTVEQHRSPATPRWLCTLRAAAVSTTTLAAVAVGLAGLGAFFSIVVVNMAAALGWLGWLLARFGADDEASRAAGAGLQAGLVVPLVAFLGFSALSTLLGLSPRDGLRGLAPELLAVGLAVAGARVTDRRAVRVALLGLVLAGAVAGLASVYQVGVVFDGALDIDRDGAVDIDRRAYGLGGPGQFVSHGHTSTVAMLVGLALSGTAGGVVASLIMAGAALAGVGVLTSFTRASWIVGAGLAIGVLAWRRAYVALGVAVALVVGVVVLSGTGTFIDRIRSSADVRTEGRNAYRVVRYQMGAAVIRDYPVLGVGVGGLKVVLPKYTRPGADGKTHLHNTALQILAERGPLTLAAWLALVVGAAVRVLRLAARATGEARCLPLAVGLGLVAALAQSNFDYDWQNWKMRALMLVFVGLAWSPALAAARPDASAAPRG